MPSFEETFHCQVRCLRATEKAILVRFIELPDEPEIWIPQSQVDDDSEVWKPGDEGTLVINEWIARKNGIIE